ncbi:MAG: 50S ribosomal protein L25 [Oscillospiraceae bacterium]|nr:50S ribosomal protein L25 [Oscillospiraceae bacterium]MDD4413356.1 50S ribosomal protein L25 [Oscillospiraceae bacterium]
MFILKSENRDTESKPKQLRRNGIIPGVLYGKNLKESVSIQIPQSEVMRFLQTNSTGSRVELMVGNKKHMALLREVTYIPTTNLVEHLSFQALQADEAVDSTARIVLVNKDKVSGMVQQQLSDISYRALPLYLVDRIEVDLEGLKEGDSIRIGDLDVVKNPNIEVLTPLDVMVASVVDSRVLIQKTEDEEEEEESEATETTETESKAE